ncbi:hypothetical protein DFH29DRAFT_913026 [Suillus ampliporus]|nr:hypothetical protein DFH29DRAFT_913026 [Suillus ampliporus]
MLVSILILNQPEIHPYVWNYLQPAITLHQEHRTVDPIIETIRTCLESTRGEPVVRSQVLTKWLQQHNTLVIATLTKVEGQRGY